MEYFADIKYRMLLNQRILAKGYPGGRGTLATVKRIQQAAATGTWPHQLARLRRPRGISCSHDRGATDASWMWNSLCHKQAVKSLRAIDRAIHPSQIEK